MKTKLEMAHDYLRDIVSNWEYDDSFDPVAEAWKYADAMQAEADKREKEKQEKLKQDQQNHHAELVSIGLEEWQPDWNQAPDGYDWFVVGGRSGKGFFCLIEPKIINNLYWFVGEDCLSVDKHDYQGDWRDSLRKRPK